MPLPIILSFGALYAALYAAYGAESPFLALFLRSKGLSPEKIGFVFAMGTLVRVLTGSSLWNSRRPNSRPRGVILCACAAAAAVIALLYLVAQSYTALLAVGITHSLASTPLAPFVDTLSRSRPHARNSSLNMAGFEEWDPQLSLSVL